MTGIDEATIESKRIFREELRRLIVERGICSQVECDLGRDNFRPWGLYRGRKKVAAFQEERDIRIVVCVLNHLDYLEEMTRS
jgi:hypothetical protein